MSSGISINTNLAALSTERRLTQSTSLLQRSFERLSSGLRISRASDDAAGLSVSSLLKVDSRVFAQGIRNVNDGISYYTIANSAVQEIKNVVIRGQELATQAANGTVSDIQRQALNLELQSLAAEYNRIIETTTFNGLDILSRSNKELSLQTGGSSLNVNIDSSNAELLDVIKRHTIAPDGSFANQNSSMTTKSLSADGRYFVFTSAASNLVENDTFAGSDVFLRDMLTGETRIVSTNSEGIQGNGASSEASISADGRYVVFRSSATNLVEGDTNGMADVFVKDLITGETRIVSTSSTGVQGNHGSYDAVISADGRYVAFTSNASNLVAGDSNGESDVFVKDMVTGETRLVSSHSNGTQGNDLSYRASISADGRYVAFTSGSNNLVTGYTGIYGVYVKDLLTGETRIASTSSDGTQADGWASNGFISADGRHVVFETDAANLVAGDTNGTWDIFIKDLLTGETKLVSSAADGTIGNGASFEPTASADGRYVVFYSSATNLVNGDTNGYEDIFVKDLLSGQIQRVSVSQSGREPTDSVDGNGSYTAAISADGRSIAFLSDLRDMLDGSTTNNHEHLYTTANPLAFLSSISRLQWVDVSTQAQASLAQETLKNYLTQISAAEGQIGSSLSRFQVAVNNLQIARENYDAASSQITDVDVANESAFLLRTQIIQQAAAAILAQAQQAPELALGLLN